MHEHERRCGGEAEEQGRPQGIVCRCLSISAALVAVVLLAGCGHTRHAVRQAPSLGGVVQRVERATGAVVEARRSAERIRPADPASAVELQSIKVHLSNVESNLAETVREVWAKQARVDELGEQLGRVTERLEYLEPKYGAAVGMLWKWRWIAIGGLVAGFVLGTFFGKALLRLAGLVLCALTMLMISANDADAKFYPNEVRAVLGKTSTTAFVVIANTARDFLRGGGDSATGALGKTPPMDRAGAIVTGEPEVRAHTSGALLLAMAERLRGTNGTHVTDERSPNTGGKGGIGGVPVRTGTLVLDKAVGSQPAASTNSSKRAAMLDLLRKQIGVRERPMGSNRGPEVDAYNAAAKTEMGSPWCAAVRAWANLKVGLPVPDGAAYSPSWFPKSRRVAAPAAGDAGGVYFPSKGRIAHLVTVEEVRRTDVVTLEGNTNAQGSREGDQFARRIRGKDALTYARWE